MRPTPNPSGQAPMQNIMLDFTNLYRSDFRSAHNGRYIAKLITLSCRIVPPRVLLGRVLEFPP